MKDNGKKRKLMGTEYFNIAMVINTKENGKMA